MQQFPYKIQSLEKVLPIYLHTWTAMLTAALFLMGNKQKWSKWTHKLWHIIFQKQNAMWQWKEAWFFCTDMMKDTKDHVLYYSIYKIFRQNYVDLEWMRDKLIQKDKALMLTKVRGEAAPGQCGLCELQPRKETQQAASGCWTSRLPWRLHR